jgi:hypothetical protein
MKDEQKILDMYVARDDLRPVLQAPFTQGGYVYATDARILIRIRESVVTGSYPVAENPNNSRFFIETNREETITIQQLEELLSRVEMIEETHVVGKSVTCEECGGSGLVYWEHGRYEKEDDCPACDGSGYSQQERKVITGNMTLNKLAPVKLGGRTFSAGYIQTIVQTMELLGIHEIAMRYNEYNEMKQVIFNFSPDVDVILMPIHAE